MQSVRIHKYDPVDELRYEQTSIPTINADEILIRVHAAGVNPVDWKIREGYFKDAMPHALPLILGWDSAGEVALVGDSVHDLQAGDVVYAYTSLARPGAYAEYVVAKADEVALQPKNISPQLAAAVPLAALTAWQALFDVAKLKKGDTVLIHAGAGGVGHFAIQLAKWKGATVIATASSQNQSFLAELGADQCIDYNTSHWEKNISHVDIVIDSVGGDTQERSWPLIKPNGILISIVSPALLEEHAKQYGVRSQFFIVAPNGQQLGEITKLIDQDLLKPFVSASFPLSAAKKAHELSQQGHVRGKIVLLING